MTPKDKLKVPQLLCTSIETFDVHILHFHIQMHPADFWLDEQFLYIT